jgi:predicted N-acetyltransferase YhbS
MLPAFPEDSGAGGQKGRALYRLEEETEADWWEVEALYDLCFAPGRTALSSYRLRDGEPMVTSLCPVLRDGEGILAAVIRYWPAVVDGRKVLLLGPVAVHPTRQGEGLGGLLIHESLAEARRLGWKRVLLVGDAPYYGRFGFEKLEGVEMPPPTNPDRVLGLELVPGAWDGVRGVVEKATDAGPD